MTSNVRSKEWMDKHGLYEVRRKPGMGYQTDTFVEGGMSREQAVDTARQYNKNNHVTLYYVRKER